MDLTVAVCSYGEQRWRELAESRAVPSALDQAPVIRVHEKDGTLAEVRNKALARVTTEWVVFLDADDELEAGYVEAMDTGTADLRAPYVRQVRNGRIRKPPFIPQVWGHGHACTAECLPEGSWLVVGTCVRTELLRSVGGWWEEPIYEDWSVFLRCYLAGGTVEAIHGAVYRAHVNASGRNHSLPPDVRNEWHYKILSAAQAAKIGGTRAA